jgi:hypothetical protein
MWLGGGSIVCSFLTTPGILVESKGFGEATILLHIFSAELRKAQQKKATGDGRITNFFQKV